MHEIADALDRDVRRRVDRNYLGIECVVSLARKNCLQLAATNALHCIKDPG